MVVLASKNAIKRKLIKSYLKNIEWEFKSPNINEMIYDSPEKTAIENALLKTKSFKDIVIASESFVYYKGILKAKSTEQARLMLKELSGKVVEVYTATVVVYKNKQLKNLEKIKVKVKKLDKSLENEKYEMLERSTMFDINKDIEWFEGDLFSLLGINIKFVEEALHLIMH